MGTCISNHQQLLKEISKCENNKLILEHLKQNQENFDALAKSVAAVAAAAANNNHNNTNNGAINSAQSNNCCSCKCQCHLNQADLNTLLSKLASLSHNEKPNETKSNLKNNENFESFKCKTSAATKTTESRKKDDNKLVASDRCRFSSHYEDEFNNSMKKSSKLKNSGNILIISSTSCNENSVGLGIEVNHHQPHPHRSRTASLNRTSIIQKVYDCKRDELLNNEEAMPSYDNFNTNNNCRKNMRKKLVLNEGNYLENEDDEYMSFSSLKSIKNTKNKVDLNGNSFIDAKQFSLIGAATSTHNDKHEKGFIKLREAFEAGLNNHAFNCNSRSRRNSNHQNNTNFKVNLMQPEFGNCKKNVEFNEDKNQSYRLDERIECDRNLSKADLQNDDRYLNDLISHYLPNIQSNKNKSHHFHQEQQQQNSNRFYHLNSTNNDEILNCNHHFNDHHHRNIKNHLSYNQNEDLTTTTTDEIEIEEDLEEEQEENLNKAKKELHNFNKIETSSNKLQKQSASRSFYDNVNLNKLDAKYDSFDSNDYCDLINSADLKHLNNPSKSSIMDEQICLINETILSNKKESIDQNFQIKNSDASLTCENVSKSSSTTVCLNSINLMKEGEEAFESSPDTYTSSSSSCSLTHSLEAYCDLDTVVYTETLKTKGARKKELENVLGSDENKPQTLMSSDRLKLNSIVEAVGFIMFPSNGFMRLALSDLFNENRLHEFYKKILRTDFESNEKDCDDDRYLAPCEDLINKSIYYLIEANKLNEANKEKKHSLKYYQKRLGHLYLKNVYLNFSKELQSISDSMENFFNNLNSFHESLLNNAHFSQRFLFLNEKYFSCSPSFRCEASAAAKANFYELNVYLTQEKPSSFVNNFYFGVIESIGKHLWNLDVCVEKIKTFDLTLNLMSKNLSDSANNNYFNSNEFKACKFILGYKVKLFNASLHETDNFVVQEKKPQVNRNGQFCVSLDIFNGAFPFSILIDACLNIRQLGDGLLKHLGPLMICGEGALSFFAYFSIELPKLSEYSFQTLCLNQNMNFRIRMKSVDEKSSQLKDMQLKGSVCYVHETDCLLFIGSPIINNLDELTGRGLYISDIPIHDATRDLILVGEQTKAQEGLKCRMEKLKKSIVKAHEDIEEEKSKNIELLNLIFPSDIAEKLWRGEKVPARSIINVTLLYSDVVGFTSICSTAQPIEIIEMLKRLYTDFDNYCGLLDIYKIETIGDAYIVAGGLHKPSKFHAERVAWMSLLMMQSSASNFTHKGDRIKIRVGLHTGDVLAGIVGIKQPRYCLFGHNCTITNKFESTSEEMRIHVSPVTKRLLDRTDGFEFEARNEKYLPENWMPSSSDPSSKEISWFLNSYTNKTISKDEDIKVHVQAALDCLEEEENYKF